MKKCTYCEMFGETEAYIDRFHSDNPMDFVTNVYIFYYMSGRYPSASLSDCCTVVEALRKHYDELRCINNDLSSDDEELPFY